MKASGQVFSSEFLLAYFIFMTVLVLSVLLWYNTTRDITEVEAYKVMDSDSSDAAEQLVKTQGIPSAWTKNNVASVGLANESRILDGEKISNFIELMNTTRHESLCGAGNHSNYDCSRHLLGLAAYDFHFNLSYLNGSVVVVDGMDAVTGRLPQNQSRLITVIRNALYDGEMVKLTLTVWYSSLEESY